MNNWFTTIASQVTTFTDELLAQANAAQADILNEQKRIQEEERIRSSNINKQNLLLPWETTNESKAILTQTLMENILSLSLNEKNFCTKPYEYSSLFFNFNDFIPTAMKLIEIDCNLAKIHAKLSPKMSEEDFWGYYYYRIMYLRVKVGVEDDDSTCQLLKDIDFNDIIYQPNGDVSSNENCTTVVESITTTTTTGTRASNTGTTVNDDDDGGDDIVDTAREQRRMEDALLAAEVEAELENDYYDIANSKSIDQSSKQKKVGSDIIIDDDDDDGFEDLGDIEIDDDELEQQIALELLQSNTDVLV